MHRVFQVAVPPGAGEDLAREVAGMDDVIGVWASRGSSVKPRGDVVTVYCLNTAADDVLRHVQERHGGSGLIIATIDASSLINPKEQDRINGDVDEQIWEEMEASIRARAQLNFNFLALSGLGGAIAALALVSGGVEQAIAIISASIIAPAFEPVAKIPLGWVLRDWALLRSGLKALAGGYATMIAAAAAMFTLLGITGSTNAAAFVNNPAVRLLATPTVVSLMMSVCAAAAAVTIESTYRESILAGPVAALVLTPGAAMIGEALAAWQGWFLLLAVRRLSIDVALIVIFGIIVFGAKQRRVHRRKPAA